MANASLSYPHLTTNERDPRLTRLPRIRVSMIVADHLAHGWSAAQIREHYPHLRLSEIHSALAYYFDNPEETDRILASELESSKQRTESPLRLKLLLAKRSSSI
ncbi:MAG: DUF433 domain-containing protein [Verrucomicrobiota bacterium]